MKGSEGKANEEQIVTGFVQRGEEEAEGTPHGGYSFLTSGGGTGADPSGTQ